MSFKYHVPLYRREPLTSTSVGHRRGTPQIV